MTPTPVHYLKTGYHPITNVLWADVNVGAAFDPTNPFPPVSKYKAIWDTGATNSVITQKVVDVLGLKPVSVVLTKHAQGESMAEVFLISLGFPDSFGIASLRVTKGILGGFDVLIGMDLICLGDLAITNHSGRTELTFQMPSQGLRKLAAESEKLVLPPHGPNPSPVAPNKLIGPVVAKPQPIRVEPKPGRNHPCPCGSGKKYKLCCGKAA